MSITPPRIDINLERFPQADDSQVYEALLEVHNAIETLVKKLNESIARQGVVRKVTSGGNIELSDSTIVADSTGGNINLTLPTVDSSKGFEFVVKHLSGVNVTKLITTDGSQIDEAVDATVPTASIVRVISDGSNWWII